MLNLNLKLYPNLNLILTLKQVLTLKQPFEEVRTDQFVLTVQKMSSLWRVYA